MVLHEMGEPLLKKSIEEGRRAGYLPNGKIWVALDTTPILGKGAAMDTYNLLAEGIVKLAGRLAEVEGKQVRVWAERQGLSGYWGSSLKGAASRAKGSDRSRGGFAEAADRPRCGGEAGRGLSGQVGKGKGPAGEHA